MTAAGRRLLLGPRRRDGRGRGCVLRLVARRGEGRPGRGRRPGDVFSQVYGLKREPNFEGGRYVLLEPRPRSEQAESFKTTPEELEERLRPLRAEDARRPGEAARPAPRRQGPDRLERPDDRRLCRRLPGAQERVLSPCGREGRRLPADEDCATPAAGCCGPTGPARPSCRAISRTMRSWSTACSGSTPRRANPGGWTRPARWPTG